MLNPHPFPFGYHHKIQEKIKSGRKNKNKRINFPKDLLNSAKFQHMLRNKVSLTFNKLINQINLTLEGDNKGATHETAFISRVCGLAD